VCCVCPVPFPHVAHSLMLVTTRARHMLRVVVRWTWWIGWIWMWLDVWFAAELCSRSCHVPHCPPHVLIVGLRVPLSSPNPIRLCFASHRLPFHRPFTPCPSSHPSRVVTRSVVPPPLHRIVRRPRSSDQVFLREDFC